MTRERRLVIAVVLNVVLVAAQVAAGAWAHSLGLIADAGHNLTDVGAVALAWFAVRLTSRPPNPRRSFGYHRSTILAAQANAVALILVTAAIAFEAIRRLIHPVTVHAGVVVPVAAAAVVLNVVAAATLQDHSDDLNMRGALLHMFSDALTAAAVVVAGVVILVTNGTYWLDPAMSLVIGTVIAFRAVQLLVATTGVLLESAPVGMDTDALAHAIVMVDGVEAVHDLHTWSLSSEYHALSAHIVLEGEPSLEEAHEVCERVKDAIGPAFHIAHATLEPEVEACLPADVDCIVRPT